ncbi:hypothetical protein Prudu_000192 [Prunus dulcis]|uniref:Uncharacterized protein n=1 Tax=Prunus dulcis TaxID=3755 RepID=A0A4Y1QKN0_PRUDU|nr:hypothetical protein Prudu_000192 [Prunus dulcis]
MRKKRIGGREGKIYPRNKREPATSEGFQ